MAKVNIFSVLQKAIPGRQKRPGMVKVNVFSGLQKAIPGRIPGAGDGYKNYKKQYVI